MAVRAERLPTVEINNPLPTSAESGEVVQLPTTILPLDKGQEESLGLHQLDFWSDAIHKPPRVDRDYFGRPIKHPKQVEEAREWARNNPPEHASVIIAKLESGEYSCMSESQEQGYPRSEESMEKPEQSGVIVQFPEKKEKEASFAADE